MAAIISAQQKRFQVETTTTADLKKKQAGEQEQFDKFLLAQPQICFSVFFREMEYRLLQTIGASRDRMHHEYEKTRKGQCLTQLDNELYAMRDTLKADFFVDSFGNRSLVHLMKKKGPGNKDRSTSKTASTGRKTPVKDKPSSKERSALRGKSKEPRQRSPQSTESKSRSMSTGRSLSKGDSVRGRS